MWSLLFAIIRNQLSNQKMYRVMLLSNELGKIEYIKFNLRYQQSFTALSYFISNKKPTCVRALWHCMSFEVRYTINQDMSCSKSCTPMSCFQGYQKCSLSSLSQVHILYYKSLPTTCERAVRNLLTKTCFDPFNFGETTDESSLFQKFL